MFNEKENLSNGLVYRLLSLSSALYKVGNRITKEFGLTQQQFVALNKIVTIRIINQKELTSSLSFEKSNISKIVKKLNSLGLILVEKDNSDSRITNISPTEKGIKLWEEIVSKFNEWNNNYTSSLTIEEIKNSIKVSDKLNYLIEDEV